MRNFAAVGSSECCRRRARCSFRAGVGELVYFVCVCVCVLLLHNDTSKMSIAMHTFAIHVVHTNTWK